MNPPLAPSRHRHAMAWAMLIFCAVLLSYMTFWAPSDPLREQLSLGLLALMGSTFGTYAFGVSWDFRSNRNRKSDLENP